MKHKRGAVVLELVLIGIILIHLSSAQAVVDSQVEELLKTQNELYVSIMLKVPANLEFDGSMSADRISELSNLRKDYFNQMQTSIISTLSESDFKLTKKYSTINGFRGNITKIGFEILKNNQDILSIHMPLKGTYLLIEDEKQLEILKSCEEDFDCVIIQEGCCDCNNGGMATTINIDYKDYWNKVIEDECEGIGCYPSISDDITCSFIETKCLENKCVFKEIENTNQNFKVEYLILFLSVLIIIIFISYLLTKKRK